jgi:hypothetical protein
MSYYIKIEKNKPVKYGELLNSLSKEEVMIAYSSEEMLDTPIDKYYKFLIPGKSSRGVQVGLSENSFEIIINVFCSREDYYLATEIAANLSKLTESEIEPEQSPIENRDKFSAEEFKTYFNQKWVEENCMAGISAFRHIIKKDGTITIAGCYRNVYLGRELLSRYENEKTTISDEELYDHFIRIIRMIQFIPGNIYVPNEFEVTEKDGSKWRYITLMHDKEQVVRKSEFVLLFLSKEEYLKVPFMDFQKYCKENFNRLDEEQYIMPKYNKMEFLKLMKRFGFNNPNQNEDKKWWKIW